ncbi:MAG: hypothetical protein J0H67_08460 [Rhodospirillales bacterium]|nr:hypothetical protein [Rhodospirillales bacterium]
MPAPVVLVHTSQDLLDATANLLSGAGQEVATYTSSLSAIGEIKSEGRLKVLVTCLVFPEGQPNGISLASMTLHHRPSAKIIFTARPDLVEHVDFGELLLSPVTAEQLAAAVRKALD